MITYGNDTQAAETQSILQALEKIKRDPDGFQTWLAEETNRAEKEGLLTYLNVIAAVAPMIGLLGTVSGMIGAFQTMATSGMGRPELFAGNIGEALITTATGLVIGIPSMICFFMMRNRVNNGMLATIQAANVLMDTLDEGKEEET